MCSTHFEFEFVFSTHFELSLYLSSVSYAGFPKEQFWICLCWGLRKHKACVGRGMEASDLHKAGVGRGSLHKAGTRKEMSRHRWKNCLLAWGQQLEIREFALGSEWKPSHACDTRTPALSNPQNKEIPKPGNWTRLVTLGRTWVMAIWRFIVLFSLLFMDIEMFFIIKNVYN